MIKRIAVFILLCFSTASAFGQTEKYDAPVKWERYNISDKNVSVLFPKLPVSLKSSDICKEQTTTQYFAYAERSIYGFTIISKLNRGYSEFCREKKKFNESSFANRLDEIKSLLQTGVEIRLKIKNADFVKITGGKENFTYWLVDDFTNKRWFEFRATRADGTDATIKNFLESLELQRNPNGIEIGDGSSRMLGDGAAASADEIAPSSRSESESDAGENAPLKIYIKPKPPYTDAARQASVQGIVVLRVTFLASGGIGDVKIVKPLSQGLTEQATSAAKKIAFIAAKKNGKYFTEAKVVEYSFSIY